MGIVDLIGFKWKLNKPFLTKTEAQILKKLRTSGRLSSFRVLQCEAVRTNGERCPNEVPIIKDDAQKQIKRFCSEKCFNNTDNEDENDVNDTEDDDA